MVRTNLRTLMASEHLECVKKVREVLRETARFAVTPSVTPCLVASSSALAKPSLQKAFPFLRPPKTRISVLTAALTNALVCVPMMGGQAKVVTDAGHRTWSPSSVSAPGMAEPWIPVWIPADGE